MTDLRQLPSGQPVMHLHHVGKIIDSGVFAQLFEVVETFLFVCRLVVVLTMSSYEHIMSLFLEKMVIPKRSPSELQPDLTRISSPAFLKLKTNVLLFFQVSDPVPIKKSKHDDFPSQSPLADKEKQHDWLQSLSASNKVGVAKLRRKEMLVMMRMMHGA